MINESCRALPCSVRGHLWLGCIPRVNKRRALITARKVASCLSHCSFLKLKQMKHIVVISPLKNVFNIIFNFRYKLIKKNIYFQMKIDTDSMKPMIVFAVRFQKNALFTCIIVK